MGKLRMVLPPFSPDYSGVCSALFSFGKRGITVLHDAAGCTGNYTGYDEPRWYHSKSPVYCSGLREIDAILGDDEKLMEKVIEAEETLKPELIALVGSPVPMVVGTDMEGIAADLEGRTGIPVFGFDTTGLGSYQQGIELVYRKVLCRMFSEMEEKEVTLEKSAGNKGVVNILGATPLDFGGSGTVEKLCRLLEQDGWQVQTVLYQESSREQILQIRYADCSVVVSGAALSFANYLKQNFGIPYITKLPFGEAYAKVWLRELEACVFNKDREDTSKEAKGWEKEPVRGLVLGEQIQSEAIRDGLWEAYKIRADVGAVCGFYPETAQNGEVFLEEEAEIEQAINRESYEFVVGDPLYQGLLRKPKRFIPYAHYALSSKMGQKWEDCLIGSRLESKIQL